MINKRKKGGWIKWAVLVVVVAVLGVFAFPTIQSMLTGNSAPTGNFTGNIGSMAQLTGESGGDSSSTARVARGSLKVAVSGTGKVSPSESSTVYSLTTGRVDDLDVEVGDAVQAGDVIMRLNSDDLTTTIATLTRELFDAQVTLSEVRDSGSSYNIYAPTAGRVKAVKVEKEDDVASAMKQYGYLAIISRDDKMKVEFVPETAADLQIGDKVNVLVKSTTVQGTVDQLTGLSGKIAVSIEDDEYDIGEHVVVSTLLGQKLGEGDLEVNMAVPVTGVGGTVSSVYYEDNETVSSGSRMFYLTGRTPSAALQTALLAYNEAKVALDSAVAKQDGLVVRAPIDGVITAINTSKGAQLAEGSEAFSIQSNNSFKVVASVDELDIVNVKPGQNVTVELDAYPNQTFNAVVKSISGVGTVESGVATYDVTVVLSGNDGFMDGMTANIEVVTEDKSDALLVPVEAISVSNGQSYVTLSTGDRVNVTTGSSDGTNIEITSGLSEGESVRLTRTTNSGSVGSYSGSGSRGGTGMMGGAMPSGAQMTIRGGF